MLSSNAFFSIVNKPTRVTSNSSILIDHIFTHNISSNITPGILLSDISDRYPTFALIKNDKKNKTELQNKFYRSKAHFNPTEYVNDLQSVLENFCNCLETLNIDNFDQLLLIIKTKIDQLAPLKKYSRKQRRLKQKPWITKAILRSIINKQKLYISYFIHGDPESKLYFKKYANLLTQIKERAKALYYQDTLESHRRDTHATWKVLKAILASSANRSWNNQPPYIEANSKNLTCAEDTAEEFNNFFSSIGEKLASNIAQQSEVSSSFYLRNKIFSSI